MATIALNGNTFGCTLGMGAFEGIGTAFSSAKQSVGGLNDALSILKSKIDFAAVTARLDMSQEQVQKAKERESVKKSALTVAYEKLDTLISDVGMIDQRVSDKINQRKKEFYNCYSYLKPECEKSGKEKWNDYWTEKWQNFKEFLGGVGEAIAGLVNGVVDWCKEHWKELLLGLGFIIIGAVITAFTAGTGTALWVAVATALGKGLAAASLSAVIGGIVSSGSTYYQFRKAGMSHEVALENAGKAFGNGMANGFMTGGIGFAVGAGAIGIFGKGILIGKRLGESVGRGAIFGATVNAITSPTATAISYWLKNGTLKDSGAIILQSTVSGIISGAVFGGAMGGMQFKYAEYKINKLETSIENRGDLKGTQKGRLFEKELINEYKKRFPDAKFESQCRLNSEKLLNKKNKLSYQKPDLLVENDNKFTNYEFKWGAGRKTYNQTVLTNDGNTHVMDTVISHSKTNFSTNIVPAGTPFKIIRQSSIDPSRSFNSVMGVPISRTNIIGGSLGIEAGLNRKR